VPPAADAGRTALPRRRARRRTPGAPRPRSPPWGSCQGSKGDARRAPGLSFLRAYSSAPSLSLCVFLASHKEKGKASGKAGAHVGPGEIGTGATRGRRPAATRGGARRKRRCCLRGLPVMGCVAGEIGRTRSSLARPARTMSSFTATATCVRASERGWWLGLGAANAGRPAWSGRGNPDS